MDTTVEKLHNEIEASRGRLATLLADPSLGLSRTWEQAPGADEWSARETAEHVVQNEYFLGGELAKATGRQPREAPPIALATPGAAVDALATAATYTREVVGGTSNDDLAKPWMMEMTVKDLVGLCAAHLSEHTGQIAATHEALAVAG